MKKIRLLLSLIVASICSVQGAWARTAPTFPEAQTLESGKAYYLYNVGTKKFIYQQYSGVYRYVNASETSKTSVLLTAHDNGYYTMQFTDNGLYLYDYDQLLRTNNSPSGDYTYFRIAETEGGYTIQRNYKYDATLFVGIENGSSSVYSNYTSGNIVWQLFDEAGADAVLHYWAKKALYDALETAEVNYAWAIADFEAIYENEASTTAELNAAATALNKRLSMSNGYQAPWWNERPILFYTADGNFGQWGDYTWALPNNSYTSGSYFHRYLRNSGETSSISATVLIEEPSTLVYSLANDPTSLDVYVDDELVRHLSDNQCNHYPSEKTYTRFFEKLSPGLHKITWTVTALEWRGYADVSLINVGVMASPQITVNLLEPGSLGTEVLYNTDHIKNVRRLKVKGAMNSDDWARIKMMSTLIELDLSEAQITEIPAQQFYVSSSDTTMNFLHKVVLPEGLSKINSSAFYNSFVEDVNFPSTLRSIGYQAFYMSHISEAILPDYLTEMGEGVFNYAYWLKKAHFGKNLTIIPDRTFANCIYLTDVVLPEKLKIVGFYGFHSCLRLQTTLPEGLETLNERSFEGCRFYFIPKLPKSLKTIGVAAFNDCDAMDSLIVPSSVTSIGQYAFCNCDSLKYAELSIEQYTIPKGIFDNTPKLEVIKLNSSTVVNPTIDGGVYPHRNISQLTLQVPHYLVNSYKLHSYWYNAKAIEPFDYSDIDYIPIWGNLTLNHERFGGNPSIYVHCPYYLKINGEKEQKLNEIGVSVVGNTWDLIGQLLNNCDKVTATGDNRVGYWTDAKKWYFISLPFDLDVSRITHDASGTQYAIRYYDGAGRATNGKSGNWKNVDRTGIIPAGTGFIYQTNIGTWTFFYAADTENKYGTLRTTEFNKTLAVNASETASNRGWNLVGNPYQCFYNNHALNFTAPITVWNGSTYVAYSLTDDDYAIRPNEAFFVQCPNEEYSTIGFPIQGRQLTSVIESQNASRALVPEKRTRQVVNLTVSNGEMEDMTRVVLNEGASMAYEVSCDASKFMSMDGNVPQIYSLDADGTQYAINERPMGEGTIALGFYAGKEGNYTITATRCDAEKVFLTDLLHGITTELTDAPYTFSAEAGSDITRFTLSFVAGETTGVQEIEKKAEQEPAKVFSADGKFLGSDVKHLGTGVYIVRQGKKVSKVVLH